VRYIVTILICLAFSVCLISCTAYREQQDRMIMWEFKEYQPWRRYGAGDGLIEHWVVEGVDHFIYIYNLNETRKPGDTEYWPISK
jgi:hypothetical protein